VEIDEIVLQLTIAPRRAAEYDRIIRSEFVNACVGYVLHCNVRASLLETCCHM
jgi:hypothetical protein